MKPKIPRRCWDSAVCLAYLQDEDGRREEIQAMLDAADHGSLQIVISSLCIAEVLMMRGKPPIPAAHRELVRRFFCRSCFVVVELSRSLAERAQELVWAHGIRPKDAVHVATALFANAVYLDTYDAGLIGKDGQLGGSPLLRIGRPSQGTTPDLFTQVPGEEARQS